jgi:peptidoglycan/LPS O-acetylase OafA/YrhL
MVVFAHATWGMVLPATNTVDVLVAKAGGHVNIAMDFFFVLSGFLITGILADSKGKPHYFRNFFARRSLRVFPLYYGFITLIFLLLPLAGILIPDAEAMRERWLYFLYLQNVPFAARGDLPQHTGYLWSMAVEEQYYLIWPLAVLWFSSRALQRWCVITVPALVVLRVVLVAFGASWVLLYVSTPLRMDALLLGSYIALHVREPGGAERLKRWAKPVFIAALVAELGMIAYKPVLGLLWADDMFGVSALNLPIDRFVQALRFTPRALLGGTLLVLIATAAAGSRLQRFFGSRALRTCGKYSYATYMFHVPVYVLFEQWGWRASELPLVGGAQWPRALVAYLVLLTVSLALAALSWELYEKQFLKLKALFPYDQGKGRPIADSTEAVRKVFQSP